MALSATLYHLTIALSDSERGVYESLDLRVARHPSESMRYLLTRVIAYCLCFEEGIAFSRGLSGTDEPAIWIRDLQGTPRARIVVGTPSAERLHKASKATPRVAVFTHNDPELLRRAAAAKPIHKVDAIEVHSLEPAFLDELDAATERKSRWELVYTGGQIYIGVAGKSISGTVTQHKLT